MGFFDKILRAIGFDDEEEVVEKKKLSNKNEKVEIHSRFNLKNQTEFSVNELTKEEKKESFAPETQADIEEIAIKVCERGEAMIDFSKFSESDRVRALDFLSGVVFVMKGEIQKIDNLTYFLSVKKGKDEE